jgi:hypothetical protein
MPLINTSLPNLIQGVSQQPDATRFSGQCDEQVNFMSSVVDGLTKRNGTRFVQRLGAPGLTLSEDSFIHFINRSETERYVLLHDGAKIYAYNVLSGDEATINGVSGGLLTAFSYLDIPSSVGTPRSLLRASTVSDGTFLVNRSKTVATDQSSRAPDLDKEALIFIKQGDYEKKYAVDLTYSTTSPVAAQVNLTYSRTSNRGNSRYVLTSVGSIANGGQGYTNGQTYTVVSFPSTYSSKVVRTIGDVDATLIVGVTNAATGVVTSASVGNIGPALSIGANENVGDTISITVTLELGEAVATAGTATSNVFIRSGQAGNGNAINADTAEIAEILTDDHNTNQTASFSDVFPNILTGTNADFALERSGNLIVLTRKTGKGDFEIRGHDGLGDGALGVVYKEVGSITDLPLYAKNGFIVKVRGDQELSADDYYVKFETTDGQDIGNGAWVETFAPGQLRSYDNSTLPRLIINTSLNKFEINEIKTAPKFVGDEISNPFASFVGKNIQNSVFFKNRLGFICEGNVILSEAGLGARNSSGDFEYNFGRTTVTTLLDSDPIDVIVEAQRVVSLTAAATSQENLVLFSNNGQFVLKGEDLLTPKTVSVKPITNFEYNDETDPVSVGSYIYYPFDLGNHTGIREFSLNKTTDVYESNEITEQAPRYIPKDITYFSGSLSQNLLGVLSKDEDQSLYMYRYFFSENKKVLSSWFKWDFNMKIRGFEFIDSTLYLIVANPTTNIPSIVSMPLNFDGEDEGLATYTANGSALTTSIATTPEDNVTHLDMRIPAIIYNDQVKFPTFTAGSTKPLRENISTFVVGGTSYSPYLAASDIKVYTDRGVNIPVTVTTSGGVTSLAVTTTGVWDDYTSVWVGYEFTSAYTFSEQIFKAQAGQARTPNASAKQFIKNLSLYHTQTSDYKIKVTPDKRNTYTNEFPESFTSSGGSLQILRTELKDGFFRAPVFTSSENVEIKLENDGAKPSNFQSAEFETFVHTRSSRYGA